MCRAVANIALCPLGGADKPQASPSWEKSGLARTVEQPVEGNVPDEELHTRYLRDHLFCPQTRHRETRAYAVQNLLE